MPRYAEPYDITDRTLRVDTDRLDRAQHLVDADLWGKGIDPADVRDGDAIRASAAPLLKALAIAYASEIAAREDAVGEGSWLLDKARSYAEQAKGLRERLSRAALGLLAAGEEQRPPVGIGSVPIGRG